MLNDINTEILSVLPAIRATVARFARDANKSEIEDLVNDVVVKLLSGGLEARDGRASLKSWATITARNTAIDCNRLRRVSIGHDSVSSNDATSENGGDGEQSNMGIVLEGADGREVVESAIEASRLADAMASILDATEQAFIGAILEGEFPSNAGASVGWSRVQTSRKQPAIVAKLAKALG